VPLRKEFPRSIVVSSEFQLEHIDGINNALNHILPLFSKAGIDVLLYSGSPTKGIKNPFYPNARMGLLTWGGLNEEFRDMKPDLALAFAPALAGLVLLDWAEINSIPRAAAFNTNIPRYAKSYGLGFLEKPLWKYYKHIHAIAQVNLAASKSTVQMLRQKGFRNVEFWGRGVNDQFDPSKRDLDFRRKVTNGSDQIPLITYVGRLGKEKGLVSLIPFIQNIPFAHFVIVGDGPDRKRLEKLLKKPNVTFTGFLQGEDLAKAYASADIFLTPSTSEIASTTIIEAFKSGLPVVAFESEATTDIPNETKAILLSKPGDLTGMENNLLRLLQNDQLRKELGVDAHTYAKKQTWDKSFDQLMVHLQSLKKYHEPTIYYPVVEVAHEVDNLVQNLRRNKRAPKDGTFGTRMARKKINSRLEKGQITSAHAEVQDKWHKEFDNQFFEQRRLKIDLGNLGDQEVIMVDVQRSDVINSGNQPPLFFVPGRSGLPYGIEPLIRELFIQGRRIISVSYPEAHLSKTTEEFAWAVEHSPDYEIHRMFFEKVINILLKDNEFELWGYSTGAELVNQLLTNHNISNRVSLAVAISPASLVNQTRKELNLGIAREILRLGNNINEFPYISEVLGPKHNPFQEPDVELQQKGLNKKISRLLLQSVLRKGSSWNNAKVQNGGDILVISGKEDHIVKSDRAITELLALSNQQLRVINVINGSHLTPLTRAKEYLSLIQNHETEKYAEIIL